MFHTIQSYIFDPWLLFLTFASLIIYHSVIKNWSYFTERNVKFVRGPPILGTLWKSLFGFDSMSDDILNLQNRTPNEKLIGIYDFGGKPRYFVRDPELAKQVGIKDFDHFVNHEFFLDSGGKDPLFERSLIFLRDQEWRNMRATLSPAFTGSKMRLMFSLIGDVSKQFCEFLRNELTNGSADLDFQHLFDRFANDTIATTAFGLNVNSLKDRDNEFYKNGKSFTDISGFGNLVKLMLAAMAPKSLTKLLKIRITKTKDTEYFRNIIQETMAHREKNGIIRNDMINILMELKKGMLTDTETVDGDKDNDVGFATVQESTHGKLANSGQKWSDDDLAAQCMLFFFAGFSTISLTLSFMAHELAINPDVQKRLYEEIDETKQSLNGKSLTYEALQKMKYMDMVLSESMRMWSQVAISDRIVNKPYTVEIENGTNVKLEIGDTLFISQHGIHRDPKWFPNPNKFDPERFNDDNKGNIVAGSFMPFGIGPRSCIASRFALMECKACMYYLLSDYSLEWCLQTQNPIQLKKGSNGTVEPEKGFWMTLKQRN